ncbi:hypothetical protein Sjap_001022 [Stephania japonica]|uniref:Uncharacterized protein n=1 Tax=Stephania japonica TaxID=461633 RepID=A0AAP0KLH2_9MAGN
MGKDWVGGGGGGGDDDLGEEGMQCSKHPYKSCPGGVCGMCLQEKLGKLVSSSKSNSFSPFSSSSSASPSFRSATTTKESVLEDTREAVLLKRSKSSAAARRHHPIDFNNNSNGPRKTRFWSFIHLPSSRGRGAGGNKGGVGVHPTPTAAATATATATATSSSGVENESPNRNSSSLGRKVGRSRSVGCGSRSFSGDFLERLSTGFGDCTVLRRVESQREATKPSKDHNRIKDRVKCGGLFGGFGYAHHQHQQQQQLQQQQQQQRQQTPQTPHAHAHRRTSKSWRWSLASPIRALIMSSSSISSKPDPGEDGYTKVDHSSAHVPSLLTVRS